MNVRLGILFKPPTEEDWRAMRSLAKSLTKEPQSVRVFADANPEWLVAEFTMPTEPQYKAEPKISMAIRLYAGIETTLKSKYVEPPPKEPKFNYVIGLSTKWHGRYFYFVATYACPFPDAISPTFEVNFARLEPTAADRFNLAYMRHTEKWHELFTGLTLDECLKSISDDPWFQP